MFKRFFNENFIIILCSAALAFVLGGFGWAFFALGTIHNTPLILHFNIIDGITSVGGIGIFCFVAGFAVLAVLMNFTIAREFAPRDWFLGKFIAVITLLFGVLLFIAFAAIINANI